jgi:hypothetical protein
MHGRERAKTDRRDAPWRGGWALKPEQEDFQMKPGFSQSDRKLAPGILKHLQNLASVTLGDVSYTPAALVQLLQGCADAVDAALTLKAKWQKAVAAARVILLNARPIIRAFKQYLQVTYGNNAEVLQDFGQTPRKTGKPLVETKAQALVKQRATRVLRGTKGKRQKKAIKAGTPASPK